MPCTDGKSQGVELVLGKYESEYDWSSGGKGGADVTSGTGSNHNRLQRFHSQFYSNGTKCDLTGEPRKAEVRVGVAEMLTNLAYLLLIFSYKIWFCVH